MILNPRFKFGPYNTPALDYSGFEDQVVLGSATVKYVFYYSIMTFTMLIFSVFSKYSRTLIPFSEHFPHGNSKFPNVKRFVDAVAFKFSSQPSSDDNSRQTPIVKHDTRI